MTTALITYNGKTLSFPLAPYRFTTPDYPLQSSTSRTLSGVADDILLRADAAISIGFQRFVNATADHATLKRNLQQWLQWAQTGQAWTFARDSTKTANTTLSSAAAAGASSVVITNATGLVIGNQYILRSKDNIELVKISNIASTTITLTETLNFGYATGSRFRDELYWPGRLLDKTNPIIEQPIRHWGFELTFAEDVNGL